MHRDAGACRGFGFVVLARMVSPSDLSDDTKHKPYIQFYLEDLVAVYRSPPRRKLSTNEHQWPQMLGKSANVSTAAIGR